MRAGALILCTLLLAVSLQGIVSAADTTDTCAFLFDFGDGRTYWTDVPLEAGMTGYDVFVNATEVFGFSQTYLFLEEWGHQIMSIEGYSGNYNFSDPNAPYDFWRLLKWESSSSSWIWSATLLDGIDPTTTDAIAFIFTRWTYMGPPTSTPSDRDTWITERGDYSNTGSLLGYAPSSIDPRWTKELGNGAVDATAIYAAGHLYAVTSGTTSDGTTYDTNGKIFCLTGSGDVVWSDELGNGHHVAAPMYWNGYVYVPSADGKLYAFNAENGFQRWSYDTGTSDAGIVSSPVMYQNLIIVANEDGNVVAVDQSGAPKWSEKLATTVSKSPAVRNGLLLISGDDGTLYALAGDGSKQEWSVPLGSKVTSSPIATADQVLVSYASGSGGGVAAVNYDGDLEWKAETESAPGSAALISEGVVSISEDGLTLVDLNGTDKWTTAIGSASSDSMVIAVDGMSYVVTSEGGSKITAVDSDGAVAWNEDLGSAEILGAPSMSNGSMYLPSSGGSLLAYSFVDLQREDGGDNNGGSSNGGQSGGTVGGGENPIWIAGVAALVLLAMATIYVRWHKRKSS
ncbi:MAG: outer membrane biogenesis protein BamB [Methanomassiliicoccales archaeon PtaB.Bin215]|nr:MAG: outer membrane biogenesis protein BamB [Methanomassiliicoccales archaeon PtaB.Bin215]